MVPVTIVREVDGKSGALQFAPVKTMDEVQRQAQQVGGGAWCPLPVQWESMMIFDALTANDARSFATIFYNLSNWQVMLVGFDNAFSASTESAIRFRAGKVSIGKTWQDALRALDDETLKASLGEVLNKRRVRALADRRDLLLNQ